ncbi:1-acyl-sn-glycerol-3-phosphate acyltransferase [Alphaproteobacteria bacterium]|nr:1-acyl-sn-glycerol-3-phosphate acyltransferase [Alphaproteobacteria bacterium]
MIVIRSIIFNILFFSVGSVIMLLAIPILLFKKDRIFDFWKLFSKITAFISEKIGGIGYIIENEQNILSEPAIYAVRHESVWETLVLIYMFKEPIFVLKKELLKVPLFGILSKMAGSIEVDRDSGTKSLVDVAKRIEKTISDGHPVIIFPEGTRVPTGEHMEIKRGIAFFYSKSNCAVVPVVHNSGKFWPRRGFLKIPGNITVKFLDPIPPGLSRDEFMNRLNDVFYSEIECLKAST